MQKWWNGLGFQNLPLYKFVKNGQRIYSNMSFLKDYQTGIALAKMRIMMHWCEEKSNGSLGENNDFKANTCRSSERIHKWQLGGGILWKWVQISIYLTCKKGEKKANVDLWFLWKVPDLKWKKSSWTEEGLEAGSNSSNPTKNKYWCWWWSVIFWELSHQSHALAIPSSAKSNWSIFVVSSFQIIDH